MFTHFDDSARIWIYGFTKNLNAEERGHVENYVKEFTRGWVSHGDQILGDFEVRENRFVFLVAENSVSGCSIDGSVDLFREINAQLGLNALDQNLIFYRGNQGAVYSCNRAEFAQRVQSGEINADTAVFDLTFATLGEARSKKFELPAGESWHAQAFKIPAKANV